MSDEPKPSTAPKPLPETTVDARIRHRQLIIWIISGIVLSLLLYVYFLYQSYNPSTDDAYVQAHVINMAAQVGGPVTNIYVNNNARVTKGQLLVLIDPRPYQATLLQAKSNYRLAEQLMASNTAAIEVAKANINKAQATLLVDEKNYQRISSLVQSGQASIASGDNAAGQYENSQAALLAAQDQLVQAQENLGTGGNLNADIQKAKADVDMAELNLAYTHIKTPATGFVTNFETRIGDTVIPQQQLFQLVEDKHWYIYANYKETQLERIRVGQQAIIEVDTYPGKVFHGYVDSMSRGSGAAFSLLPPENATGNWVKVTQRFPVKVMIVDPDPRYPLRVGASCVVRVHTRDYVAPQTMQVFAETEH